MMFLYGSETKTLVILGVKCRGQFWVTPGGEDVEQRHKWNIHYVRQK